MTRLVLCTNCGQPFAKHCRVHFDPCCPGHCKRGPIQQFEQAQDPKEEHD